MSLATNITADPPVTFKYATILDAGSSSTKIYIYRWKTGDPSTITKVYPDNRANAAGRVRKPGFAHQTPGTTADYLRPLLNGAKSFLTERADPRVSETSEGQVPIYFLATAGMRRLDKVVQVPLLQKVYDLTGEFPIFDRGAIDDNVRVITGQTEGVLAWVSLNYRDTAPTIEGLFEVGGVSAQIAYEVPESAAQGNVKICLPRKESGSYVHSVSWDGFGSDSALDELKNFIWNEAVMAGGSRSVNVGNPCLPRGAPDAALPGIIGTGNFRACLALTKHILAEGARDRSPILYYPFVRTTCDVFFGVASFHHTYKFFSEQPGAGFEIGNPYDRRLFEAAVVKYCTGFFDGKKDDHSHKRCFNAAWMLTLLHDPENGFAMNRVHHLKDRFKFSTGSEISWTLGAAVLIATHGNEGGIEGCQGAGQLSVGDTGKGFTFGYVPQPIITPVKYSGHPFISMSTTLAPSTDSLTITDKPFDALRSNTSIVNVAGLAAVLFAMLMFVYRRFRGTRPTSKNVDLPGVKYFAL